MRHHVIVRDISETYKRRNQQQSVILLCDAPHILQRASLVTGETVHVAMAQVISGRGPESHTNAMRMMMATAALLRAVHMHYQEPIRVHFSAAYADVGAEILPYAFFDPLWLPPSRNTVEPFMGLTNLAALVPKLIWDQDTFPNHGYRHPANC